MLNDKQIAFLKKVKEEVPGCGVYEIWSPSGKVYIGQSTNFHSRFKSYFGMCCKSQFRLYHSFLKYGVENHTFKVVLVEYMKRYDKEKLDALEQKLMDWYRDRGVILLNLREAGSNGKHSEETKIRLSQAKIGKRLGSDNPNWGKGCFGDANGMYGKNHSQESKDKIWMTKFEKYGDKWLDSARYKEVKRKQSIVDWKLKVSKNASGEKIKARVVVQLIKDGTYICQHESMYKAAKKLNILAPHISKSVQKGILAPTTNSRFMYKEVYEQMVMLKFVIESGLILSISA